MEELLFEENGHLGIISLNRPKALNALTLPMVKAMQAQLTDWQSKSSIHAVVIKAAEPGKVFCAGGDVRWLYEAGKAGDPRQLDFFEQEYRLNFSISTFSKPYIALLDGITMGGGVGISLHGSHPLASERFIFAMPETSIGFFPDIGASHLLHRCPGALGLYLALTGNRLGAEEARQASLVKAVLPSDRMLELIPALLQMDLSTQAHEQVDACIRRMEMPAVGKNEVQIHRSMDPCFSRSSVEGILEALEASENVWAESIAGVLRKKSPLSLKVTFEQMRKTQGLGLEACLQLDYVLARHFMHSADFYEGVRALLVDKDQQPHWQPASLDLVSQPMVQAYFS